MYNGCIVLISSLSRTAVRNFKTIASKRESFFLSDNTNCFSCAHPSSKCATTKMHSQQCHGPVIERFLLALEINHRIRIHIDSGGMAQCEMHNTNKNNRNRKFEKKKKINRIVKHGNHNLKIQIKYFLYMFCRWLTCCPIK